MRPSSKRNITAITLAIFLASCARPATPPPQPVVVTLPAPAVAQITFTPSPVTPETPTAIHTATQPQTQTQTPNSTGVQLNAPTQPPSPPPADTATPTISPTPLRSADAPTITETTVTIASYDWRDHLIDTSPGDPIYPYPRLDYDPYTFSPGPASPVTFKGLILENRYVSLTFIPELGGRLYRWQDKVTGRQMLYNNPIIQATGYGYRNWWLSIGGLEWGLPVEDHGFVEWVPWNYATVTTQEAAAVVVSIAEERTGLEAAIRIELDSAHSYFTLTPVLHNPNANPLAFQFWMTAVAAPAGDNRAGPDLRFNLPVSAMLVHSTDDKTLPPVGQSISWPIYNSRDMSLYGNWREFLSLFAAGGATQPHTGLYTPRADQGFVRIFPPQVARGLKLFGPGNLPSFLWTNDDSSYVELWGGLTSDFSQTVTLQPDESFSWTEYWYPIHNIGNNVWADKDRALSVRESNGEVTVGVYTTSAQSLQLTLFANGQPAQQWAATTAGPESWIGTWIRTIEGPLDLQLADSSGNVITRYTYTP